MYCGRACANILFTPASIAEWSKVSVWLQCKKSALVSSKRKAAKARDGQTSRSTGSQRRQDSIEQECRISKIVELLTEVVAKLDANSSPTSLTGIDGVHLLLQTLQWQLGLAMVGPCCGAAYALPVVALSFFLSRLASASFSWYPWRESCKAEDGLK